MLRENALQDVGLVSTGDIDTLRHRLDEVGLGCPIFPRAARALSIAYDDNDLEILGAMISLSRAGGRAEARGKLAMRKTSFCSSHKPLASDVL